MRRSTVARVGRRTVASDQFRRDVEYQLRALQKKRGEIVLAHQGDYSPEVSEHLAELDGEIRRLRAELTALDLPPIAQQTVNQQILEFWKDLTELRLDIREWRKEEKEIREKRNEVVDRWIVGLTLLIAVAYGVMIALGVSVWVGR